METPSYYQKNKEVLRARKRLKYRTNPEYREKCLAYQKAYLPIARKRYYHKTAYHQAHNGLWYRTVSIREFWQFIGWRRNIIRTLEVKGLLPYCIFPGAVRRYSMHQCSLIHKITNAMSFYGTKSPTQSKKMQEFMKVHTLIMHKQWYDEGTKSRPEGLFPRKEKSKK